MRSALLALGGDAWHDLAVVDDALRRAGLHRPIELSHQLRHRLDLCRDRHFMRRGLHSTHTPADQDFVAVIAVELVVATQRMNVIGAKSTDKGLAHVR